MFRSFALLLLVATATAAQPSLDAFSISSGELEAGLIVFDLTGSSKPLLLSVAASSPGTEVDVISVSMTLLNHFGGTTHLTVPNISDSPATVSFPLPRFLETGTYKLNVAVRDVEGSTLRWTHDELANSGFPNRFEVRVTGDLYPPVLENVEIANIEDAFAPQGLGAFTFNDPSGILAYRVIVESPSGKSQTIAEFRAGVGFGPTHTFSSPFDLSRGAQREDPAEEGLWTITEVRATDSNGTTGSLYTRDFTSLGLQSRFWVGPVPPEPTPEAGCGWPNPVRAGGTVSLSASAHVYDVRGRRVARADVYGALDTTGMAAGVYLARASVEGDTPCRFTVTPR